jgi:iron complex outermembrane receptor protein
VTGVSVEGNREDRRGFENFVGAPAERVLGVSGKLRRDEINRVSSRDA